MGELKKWVKQKWVLDRDWETTDFICFIFIIFI